MLKNKFLLINIVIFMFINIFNINLLVEAKDSTADDTINQMLQMRMWDAIIMKADVNYSYVRNSKKSINDDASIRPFLKNNELMVPIRFLANSLNSRVEWKETKSTVTLFYMQYEYIFTIRSDTMNALYPNANTSNLIEMPVETELINGTVYIPVRYFAEFAGFKYGVEPNGIAWFSHTELYKTIAKDNREKVAMAIQTLFSEDTFDKDVIQTVYYVEPQNGRDG